MEEYAEFWKIPYSTATVAGEESLVFSSSRWEGEHAGDGTWVISPHGEDGFRNVAEKYGLQVVQREVDVRIPVAPRVFTCLQTKLHELRGENLRTIIGVDGTPILSQIAGSNVHVLSLDIVSEYTEQFRRGLNDSPSLKFRLATKLPFSYNTIPSFIRKRAFRTRERRDIRFEQKLGPIECLRAIFLACLVRTSQIPIPRIGFWRRGKTYALSITHDVETRAGLERGAPELISVEKRLGLRSTWDVPSERYSINSDQIARLVEAGEVCGHDTAHDGRLLFLGTAEMAERMRRCKERLEILVGREVPGFRSPLLQHSRDLIAAVGRAGFRFDSSTPSWEYLSPTSLRPHGVGTVFPFFVNGVLEIPVSLPQDHQLIRVIGMSPADAVENILKITAWMRGVGGACILLVHPDYEFGQPENVREYKRLLQTFQSDSQCDIMTLSELAEWWVFRSRSRIEAHGNVRHAVNGNGRWTAEDLELQFVKGYGTEGFDVGRAG